MKNNYDYFIHILYALVDKENDLSIRKYLLRSI